jgi:hypothetical protein
VSALELLSGLVLGFGHELHVKRADPNSAWYGAKYVSKTCDDRAGIPWLDRETGEVAIGNNHYRPWTASRRWGLTMAAIRAAEAAWVQDRDRTAATAAEAASPAGPALDYITQDYTDHASGWVQLPLVAGEPRPM